MGLSDNEILRLWRNRAHQKKKMIQLLAELNACSYNDMYDRCAGLGLISEKDGVWKKSESIGRWDIEKVREIEALRQSGMTYVDIARRVGKSPSGVRRMLLKMGIS